MAGRLLESFSQTVLPLFIRMVSCGQQIMNVLMPEDGLFFLGCAVVRLEHALSVLSLWSLRALRMKALSFANARYYSSGRWTAASERRSLFRLSRKGVVGLNATVAEDELAGMRSQYLATVSTVVPGRRQSERTFGMRPVQKALPWWFSSINPESSCETRWSTGLKILRVGKQEQKS